MKREDIKIEQISFNYPPVFAEERFIDVRLNTGTVVVIEKCYESWQQYGGTEDELWVTMPIAEKYNGWLHGEDEEL